MKKILNIIFTLCISFPTFADTIKGTITGNHSPLSNATIVALNQQRQNFTPIASATTDNQGNFSLTIPKDTKYLQFSANNYITATQEYSGIPTYKINLASSTQNTTNTNPPTESANADQTITISGTVTDEQNIPIQNANIVALNDSGNALPIGCATDEQGNFTCIKIPINTQKLRVSYGNAQKDIDINKSQTYYDIKLNTTVELEPVNVTGTPISITDKEDKPVATGIDTSKLKIEYPDYECTDNKPANALKVHYDTESGTCIVDECEEGFTRTPDKLACAKKTLSKEDAEKQIAELQQNADAMKEKEQSTANKLLGAASMGAMGIGGMQALSALSEQSADAAAEQDMTAYLATFRCDYGQGQNIHGGDTDIILPGGNELISLYTEYIQLASDLKTRKESLGMSPGIESEMLLDKADTGLYDDVGTGITTGTFASLARALSDPNSADAALWAQQQADTASKLKTGLITAGAGAVIGVVGNIAINKNAPKENSEQILASYESLKKLEYEISQLPDQTASATCPTGTTGTVPNCKPTKTGIEYNSNTNQTEVASDKDDSQSQNKRIDATELEQITTVTSVDSIISTIANTDAENKNDENTISLSARNLFKLNEYTLVPTSKTIIATFATNMLSTNKDNTEYCLIVTGNTDKTGNDRINQPLSEKRAKAVTAQLSLFGIPEANILSKGAGSQNCTDAFRKEKNCNGNNCEACRNVTIEYEPSSCAALSAK